MTQYKPFYQNHPILGRVVVAFFLAAFPVAFPIAYALHSWPDFKEAAWDALKDTLVYLKDGPK